MSCSVTVNICGIQSNFQRVNVIVTHLRRRISLFQSRRYSLCVIGVHKYRDDDIISIQKYNNLCLLTYTLCFPKRTEYIIPIHMMIGEGQFWRL